MEKFSQFRDRGTQIAPFLPITPPRSTFQTLTGLLLFALRLPIFLSLLLSYLIILQHLPIGALLRKSILWCILLTSGIWWIDLQVENVKKGSLSRQPKSKLPTPGSILICTSTSPLDALYLSAIFDPVFTVSTAGSRRVHVVGLLGAIMAAFAPPGGGGGGGGLTTPSSSSSSSSTIATTTLAELCKKYGDTRIIAVFPEATTTNGRGVLRFAPCLDTLHGDVEIFPVSLRYSPADVTTPVPGTYGYTLFALLARPTHCIRVRIGEVLRNNNSDDGRGEEFAGDSSDTVTDGLNGGGAGGGGRGGEKEGMDKQSRLSERGAEALARIARSKRLNLGVKEKMAFVEAWSRNKRGSSSRY